jgi:hypothetical protein
MFKKTACLAASLLFCISSYAQTTYLQIGQEDYHLLDRLETKSGHLSPDLFLGLKPVSRKGAVKFLELQAGEGDSIADKTSIDAYNIAHAISVSGEWAEDGNGTIDSRKSWFNTFYKKQPDMLHVNTGDFFLAASPVITAIGANENNNPNNPLFTSNRGIEARGRIANKIGFYTYFTDNQEETPSFVNNWIDSADAVPGADFFSRRSGKYDYLTARGYVDFAAIKDHLNVTFGYDRHFIGNGVRSLFLSDFGASTAFLRLNTRIWKLNYQNLYMELTPQRTNSINQKLPHKYATMHHLSANVTRWLNLGMFEAVIFDRQDRYEFGYMNPIILYRQVERSLGSPDNVLLGFDVKAIVAKRLQLYGQLLLDEFTSKELLAGKGYWANKFGIQVGGKYFDAIGIKNLDLQGEINIVRPFTYAHFDSTANYTHYNQPLAHPLGSGFAEMIGIIRYQPVKKLYLSVKGIYYQKGADTGSSNYGNDIFKDYDTRTVVLPGDNSHGYTLISGIKTQCALLNFNASYELRENLFIDLGASHRRFAYDGGLYPTTSTTYVYGGVRLNFIRRDHDFY